MMRSASAHCRMTPGHQTLRKLHLVLLAVAAGSLYGTALELLWAPAVAAATVHDETPGVKNLVCVSADDW